MFHVAPKILLMFTMLMHSLLGCCIHHVHAACEDELCAAAQEQVQTTCGSCCSQNSSHAKTDAPTGEHEPASKGHDQDCCDETHCVYTYDQQRIGVQDLLIFWNLSYCESLSGEWMSEQTEKPHPEVSAPRETKCAAAHCALYQVWLL